MVRFDAAGRVASRTEVAFACSTPGASTFLDFVGHHVEAVTLNGSVLRADDVFSDGRITLPDLAADNVVVVDAVATYNSDGIGLHRMIDPIDDEPYVYTQFEPAEAKRVFACFDQPDLKATWELAVDAPAGWEVISNGAVVARPEAGEQGTWRFGELPPIPTYVLGLVGGNYHRVDDEHRGVPLGVFCRQSLAEFLDADEIFEITKAGMDLYAELFGLAYPFPKYDQVWVPEFNWGAMENVGCVTFTERTLFRSRVTEAERETRADTILHELAHMWFGNLVTMRWWDDLWLNESFATFMATHALVKATRFTDGWALFQGREKAWAYRQDQLPSTHPIAADVVDTDAVSSQFDGITYAKGASVLRQLVAGVGEDEFFAGVRDYFARHAWGNTTLADFLASLERASGRDLNAWSRVWLETAGVNTLRVVQADAAADDHGPQYEIAQEAPAQWPTLRPHRVRVGRYEYDGDRLARVAQTELDAEGSRTPLPPLPPLPPLGDRAGSTSSALLLLNDDDLAYTKIRIDPGGLELVRQHLSTIESPLTRALVWGAAWDATRDAEWRPDVLLDLIATHAASESVIGVLTPLLGHATTSIESLSAPAARAARRENFSAAAWAQALAQPPGSDTQLAWFRAWTRSARAASELDRLLAVLDGAAPDGIAIDNDVRWAALGTAAQLPELDDTTFERLLAAECQRDPSDDGSRRALALRCSRPSADAKAAAWAEALSPAALTRREAALAGMWNNEQLHLLDDYAAKYFETIEAWAALPGETGLRLIETAYPHVLASDALVTQTLAAARGATPAVARVLIEAADAVERVLRCRAADATPVDREEVRP